MLQWITMYLWSSTLFNNTKWSGHSKQQYTTLCSILHFGFLCYWDSTNGVIWINICSPLKPITSFTAAFLLATSQGYRLAFISLGANSRKILCRRWHIPWCTYAMTSANAQELTQSTKPNLGGSLLSWWNSCFSPTCKKLLITRLIWKLINTT